MDKERRIVKKIVQHLSPVLLECQEKEHELLLDINKKDFAQACLYIYQEQHARVFTMVGNDERQINGMFALYYVFAIDEIHTLVTIRTLVSEDDPTFTSLAVYIPALNWYEREVNDLLGLRAIGHPNRSPLIFHSRWPADAYPLRKDFRQKDIPFLPGKIDDFVEYPGEDVTQIPVGPIHAGIIEPGHFRFGAVGDTVLHLDARLFYTHRGIEKQLEGKTIDEALFIIERICGVCNVSHSAAFAQAVEKAAGIKVPLRAQYIRMIYLELERLYNHVGDVGGICGGFGFAVCKSQGARMREGLLRLNEEISGHRYLRGAIVPGGVKHDLRVDEADMIIKHLQELDTDFQEMTEILLSHEIAIDRMQTTGRLTKKQVMDLGGVGVGARASGVDIDCRRDLPYAAYDKINFAAVVEQDGDVLTRIKVRVMEVFNSILLLHQLLQEPPATEIYTPVPEIKPHTISMGWTESPRGENCHWLMMDEHNKIYRYRIRSASYANWPLVATAVPGNIVPDFPLINKSFELCYACCDR